MTNPSPEQPSPLQLREHVGNALQEGFNQQDAGLGAHIVTDWFVVAEVHTGSGPILRLIDSGLPLWRAVGLLKFALLDAHNDMMILDARDED